MVYLGTFRDLRVTYGFAVLLKRNGIDWANPNCLENWEGRYNSLNDLEVTLLTKYNLNKKASLKWL